MQSETTSGQTIDTPASASLGVGLSAVPLFHAAWLFAAGIAATKWFWLRPSLVLIALALLAVLCGLAAFRAQRIVWLPLAVLWFLLGAWCAWMQPHPAPAPALAALSDGLLRTVEGTVVDAGPVRGETEQNLNDHDSAQPAAAATDQRPSQRIDLRVSSLEVVTDTEDAQAPVAGGVRLTVRWPAAAPGQPTPRPFHCGERLRAVVRLLPPEIYHDPGVWSREDYLLDQGITSTATVNIDRVDRLGPVSRRISRLPRQRLAARLQLPPSGPARGHAPPARPLAPHPGRRHHAGRHGHRRPHLPHPFPARGL